MKRTLRTVATAAVLVFSLPPLTWSQPALAEDADHTLEARKFYRAGLEAFGRDDYESARVLFLKASLLRPNEPAVERNLGISEIYSGHYLAGARRLARVLHTTEDDSPKVRAAVLRSLNKAEAHLERLTIEVDVEGAEVEVDGESLGTSPLRSVWYVAPGAFELRIRAEGHREHLERRAAQAGLTTHLRVRLQPHSDPRLDVAAATDPGESSPRETDSSGPSVAWLIGGGALAVAGGMGALLWQNNARQAGDEAARVPGLEEGQALGYSCGRASIDSGLNTFFQSACSRLRDLADLQDRDIRLSRVSLGVGAAAALATATYWLWPRSPGAEAPAAEGRVSIRAVTADLRPSAFSVGLSASF